MSYDDDKMWCEAIIDCMPDKAVVTNTFVLSVLKCHRKWKNRPGQIIRKSRLSPTCSTLRVYVDGYPVDTIGLHAALADKWGRKRRSDSPRYFARQAMREAVWDQILEAKRGYPRYYEVDHVGTPFKVLMERFLDLVGIKLEDIQTKRRPGTFWPQLVDKELERRWQGYHRKHAKLEAISQREHRRRTRLQRRRLIC